MAAKRPAGTVPWMSAAAYSALLPPLSLDLLVRDVQRSTAFYRLVLEAVVHYEDADFAALRVGGTEFMLHADHTRERDPWKTELASDAQRGIGLQLRTLGELDPDEVAANAEAAGVELVSPPTDMGHGTRETFVRDPDGYEWGIGKLIGPALETKGPEEPAGA